MTQANADAFDPTTDAIVFRTEPLPRTAVGKLRKGELREQYVLAADRGAIDLEEEALLSPISSSPETPGSPLTPADIPTTDSFAYAFDIDGVLIRGGKPIPEALEAFKMLNGENEYGMKV